MRIALVAAVGQDAAGSGRWVLGRGNSLPWRLPADLKHFRELTWGKPVILGRRTFESIGKALPGRTNIVVTRTAGFSSPGAVVAGSWAAALEEAQKAAPAAAEAMVIGGAEIYSLALPHADRMYLTRVQGEFAGDAWFPEFPAAQWRETSRENHAADERNPYAYSFVILDRVR